jgi:hypothetical protein
VQLTGTGPWGVVELDADDAALLYLHIRAPDVAGEQVHGKLVQAGSMPGQGYGLLPLVGLQGYDDFFWWDVGLQGGESLRCRPAGLFGQDLRRTSTSETTRANPRAAPSNSSSPSGVSGRLLSSGQRP